MGRTSPGLQDIFKAPGPDGLNDRELNEYSNKSSAILALILNESFDRGDVPADQARIPLQKITSTSVVQ